MLYEVPLWDIGWGLARLRELRTHPEGIGSGGWEMHREKETQDGLGRGWQNPAKVPEAAL